MLELNWSCSLTKKNKTITRLALQWTAEKERSAKDNVMKYCKAEMDSMEQLGQHKRTSCRS